MKAQVSGQNCVTACIEQSLSHQFIENVSQILQIVANILIQSCSRVSIMIMEEIKLSKTGSGKQNEMIDSLSLYQQCHTQVSKLNQHLAHVIALDRCSKLNLIVPSIDALTVEIKEIEDNISKQATLQQNRKQKHELLDKKQNLLKSIQQYSKRIDKYKKQLIIMSIHHEQLLKELQENKNRIQNDQNVSDQIISQPLKNSKKLHTNQHKSSLPSLFSLSQSRPGENRLYDKKSQQNESKWSKIDGLFQKMASLAFQSIAKSLIQVAKQNHGSIKGVFRNYKTNQKMSEYVKNPLIKRQICQFLKQRKR